MNKFAFVLYSYLHVISIVLGVRSNVEMKDEYRLYENVVV